MADRETPIHIACVQYLRTMLPHGWRVVHVPNAPRSAIAGRRLKNMGMVAGFPDILILGNLNGLPWTGFLEIKAPAIRGPGKKPGTMRTVSPAGALSTEQLAFMDALLDTGHPIAVVYGVEDVRRICREWELPIRDAGPWQSLGATAANIIEKLTIVEGAE